jgi:uncharacterized damage-inducible protein DinB
MAGAFEAAMAALAVLSDEDMARPWKWRDGGEVLEVRDAFHRSLEEELQQLTLAGAGRQWRETELSTSEADRALGDLLGLLAAQPEEVHDVEPAPGEWSLRRVMRHVVEVELSFAANTRWALERTESDPVRIPAARREAESMVPAESSVADLVAQLQGAREVTNRLIEPLTAVQLKLPTIWATHDVDVRFRLHRFPSHLTEHTIQVEKVLHALGHDPREARQMVRAIWSARGAHRGRSSAADLERLDAAIAGRTAEVTSAD